MRTKKGFGIPFFLLALLFGLAWWTCQRSIPGKAPDQAQQSRGGAQPGGQGQQIPAHVLDVLSYVCKNNAAPAGYQGGRTFENREKRLPAADTDGTKIRYREWDVHPKIRGQNRGAERLITGSNSSAYYTKDHYRTFMRIER
jgi:guanyl-specific ribonuclease Sa